MNEYATPQEILDAFAKLSDKAKCTLHGNVSQYLYGTRFSHPLDLVHEALYLAVEGRRKWPRGLDFAVFLAMTARSVASANRTAISNRCMDARPVEDLLDWSRDGAAASHPSAESRAERAQTWRRVAAGIACAHARLCFSDLVAANVLEGIVAERSAAELQRALNLNSAQYDAARKRALRALRTIERL